MSLGAVLQHALTHSGTARLAARQQRLESAFLASAVTHEVLVNIDSPSVRSGDVSVLRSAVGPSGFLVLAPDVGETRTYNNLARMARGRFLVSI